MSGHSKWSQIKRQKGANDAKRGALFTKLTREIITAARQGGGDVEGNYRLRMAVDKARANSMPADNIKRAVERATGGGADAEQYEEITYEGLGPSNVAVIVAAMTDNRNRTASEVRSIFSKSGGSLTTVAWQFEPRGIISLALNGRDPDEVSLAAIDAGAADVGAPEGGEILVFTEPTDLEAVRSALARGGADKIVVARTEAAIAPLLVAVFVGQGAAAGTSEVLACSVPVAADTGASPSAFAI